MNRLQFMLSINLRRYVGANDSAWFFDAMDGLVDGDEQDDDVDSQVGTDG